MRNQVPERPILGVWRRESATYLANPYTLTTPGVGLNVSFITAPTFTVQEDSRVRAELTMWCMTTATAAVKINWSAFLLLNGASPADGGEGYQSQYASAAGTWHVNLGAKYDWAVASGTACTITADVKESVQTNLVRIVYLPVLTIDVCRI